MQSTRLSATPSPLAGRDMASVADVAPSGTAYHAAPLGGEPCPDSPWAIEQAATEAWRLKCLAKAKRFADAKRFGWLLRELRCGAYVVAQAASSVLPEAVTLFEFADIDTLQVWLDAQRRRHERCSPIMSEFADYIA